MLDMRMLLDWLSFLLILFILQLKIRQALVIFVVSLFWWFKYIWTLNLHSKHIIKFIQFCFCLSKSRWNLLPRCYLLDTFELEGGDLWFVNQGSTEWAEGLFILGFSEVNEALAAVRVHVVVRVASQLTYLLSLKVLNQTNWAVLLFLQSHWLQEILSQVLFRSGLPDWLHHRVEIVILLILHAVHNLHLEFLSLSLALPDLSYGLAVFSDLSNHLSVIPEVQVKLCLSFDVLLIFVTDNVIAILITVHWVLNCL